MSNPCPHLKYLTAYVQESGHIEVMTESTECLNCSGFHAYCATMRSAVRLERFKRQIEQDVGAVVSHGGGLMIKLTTYSVSRKAQAEMSAPSISVVVE
jgi:hypothetical protein